MLYAFFSTALKTVKSHENDRPLKVSVTGSPASPILKNHRFSNDEQLEKVDHMQDEVDTAWNKHRSEIAVWQLRFIFGSVSFATAVTLVLWEVSPLWALFMGALTQMAYALVLAVELLLVLITDDRKVKKPRWTDFLRAWWQEVLQVPAVFACRQPFFWRRLPDTVRLNNKRSSSQQAPAVVFIHGFVCNRGFWLPWMRELRKRDVPYISMNLEPVLASIDAYVPLLEQAVQRSEQVTNKKPFLVCHSMGGLVARAWLVAASGNAERVQHIITIGTPHHGTWLARLGYTESGCQMRMGSVWLKQLQEKESALYLVQHVEKFTCWYSNTDNIVFPAAVAKLDGADNRLVPGAAHVALAFQPVVMRESLKIIESGASSPIVRTAS